MSKTPPNHSLFHLYGGTEEFLDVDTLTPSQILAPFIAAVGRRNKAQRLPVASRLDEETSLFERTGLFKFGAWRPTTTHHRDRYIIVHWPTVIDNIVPILRDDFPELVRLLWYFHVILGLGSYTWHELLKRLIGYTHTDISIRKDPQLSPEERAEMSKYTCLTAHEYMFLADHKRMGALNYSRDTLKSLTQSFHATFLQVSNTSKTFRKSVSDATGIPNNEFSAFNYSKYQKRLEDLNLSEKKIFVVSPSLFTHPVEARTGLKEILFASHLFIREHGVAILREIPKFYHDTYGEECLVINVPIYRDYREHTTGVKFYKESLTNQERGATDKMVRRLQEIIELQCPRIFLAGGSEVFQSSVNTLWVDTPASHCLFVSRARLLQQTMGLSRMSLARKRSTLNKIGLRAYQTTPRVYTVNTPPLPELGGLVYTFSIFKKGRVVYFVPPWIPKRNKDVKIFGEIVLDAEGVGGYTYPRLVKHKDERLLESGTLMEWMRYVLGLPVDAFWLYIKRESKGVEQLRNAHKKKKFGDAGRPFTDVEDSAITYYYKPGMTPENKQALMDACKTRTWASIRTHALELCRRRIQNGVFDMNQLPRLRYNAKLSRLMKKEQYKRGIR